MIEGGRKGERSEGGREEWVRRLGELRIFIAHSVVLTALFVFFLTVLFEGVYSEEKVQRTLDAMKGRRDNLIKVSVTWNSLQLVS